MNPRALSFWSGLVLVLGGIGCAVAGAAFPPLVALVPTGLAMVPAGVGILAARDSAPEPRDDAPATLDPKNIEKAPRAGK